MDKNGRSFLFDEVLRRLIKAYVLPLKFDAELESMLAATLPKNVGMKKMCQIYFLFLYDTIRRCKFVQVLIHNCGPYNHQMYGGMYLGIKSVQFQQHSCVRGHAAKTCSKQAVIQTWLSLSVYHAHSASTKDNESKVHSV